MARPKKDGLDYFPLDVDCNDKSMKLLQARFGLLGFAVVVKIWQLAYKNGYYCSWDSDEQILFCQENGIDISYLNEIVEFAISKSLFNGDIFSKYKILTSSGIQKRYLSACFVCKRKDVILYNELLCINSEEIKIYSGKTIIKLEKITGENLEEKVNSEETPVYSGIIPKNSEETPQSNSGIIRSDSEETPNNLELIRSNSEETPNNSELIPKNSEETPVNSELMPQSKVKESKVKESKVEVVTNLNSVDEKINSEETSEDVTTTPILSWQEIYKKNIKPEIEPVLEELFDGYIKDGMDEEVVKEAIKESVKAGVKSAAYIDKILRACFKNDVLKIGTFVERQKKRDEEKKASELKNKDKPSNFYSNPGKEYENLDRFYTNK